MSFHLMIHIQFPKTIIHKMHWSIHEIQQWKLVNLEVKGGLQWLYRKQFEEQYILNQALTAHLQQCWPLHKIHHCHIGFCMLVAQTGHKIAPCLSFEDNHWTIVDGNLKEEWICDLYVADDLLFCSIHTSEIWKWDDYNSCYQQKRQQFDFWNQP